MIPPSNGGLSHASCVYWKLDCIDGRSRIVNLKNKNEAVVKVSKNITLVPIMLLCRERIYARYTPRSNKASDLQAGCCRHRKKGVGGFVKGPNQVGLEQEPLQPMRKQFWRCWKPVVVLLSAVSGVEPAGQAAEPEPCAERQAAPARGQLVEGGSPCSSAVSSRLHTMADSTPRMYSHVCGSSR